MERNTYTITIDNFYTTIFSSPNEAQQKCSHIWGKIKKASQKKEKWLVLKSIEGLFPSPTGEIKAVPCETRTCSKCGITQVIKKNKENMFYEYFSYKIWTNRLEFIKKNSRKSR